MDILNIAAILVTLAAMFSFINYRWLRLPPAIGLMLITLCVSVVVILAGKAGLDSLSDMASEFVLHIDFSTTLMHGMLSFLLFAGALHVNLSDLARQKTVIAGLAFGGTIFSTFLIGGIVWTLFVALDNKIPLVYCLLFGALISPTDPIAVLGILKSAGAPKSLETKITGESLFNDGVGVVIFIVLLDIASGGQDMTVSQVAVLFAKEAIGGAMLGLLMGLLAYWLLTQVDQYSVEILVTLALVMGGYSLATWVHVSGPIAIVVAGLLIGNHGRRLAMSDRTRRHLDTFWELVDDIFNTVLFVLIGMEILILSFDMTVIVAAFAVIPIVLLSRFICVSIPIILLRNRRSFSAGAIRVLTWGGLRGGISVALALSLPEGSERDILLGMTYAVVVFSILVQGLTVGHLIRMVAVPESE